MRLQPIPKPRVTSGFLVSEQQISFSARSGESKAEYCLSLSIYCFCALWPESHKAHFKEHIGISCPSLPPLRHCWTLLQKSLSRHWAHQLLPLAQRTALSYCSFISLWLFLSLQWTVLLWYETDISSDSYDYCPRFFWLFVLLHYLFTCHGLLIEYSPLFWVKSACLQSFSIIITIYLKPDLKCVMEVEILLWNRFCCVRLIPQKKSEEKKITKSQS